MPVPRASPRDITLDNEQVLKQTEHEPYLRTASHAVVDDTLKQLETEFREAFQAHKFQYLQELSILEHRILTQVSSAESDLPARIGSRLIHNNSFTVENGVASPQAVSPIPGQTSDRAEPLRSPSKIDDNKSVVSLTSHVKYKNKRTQEFTVLSSGSRTALQEFNSMVKSRSLHGWQFVAWFQDDENHCLPGFFRDPLQSVLNHRITTKIVTTLIVANAVIMAIEADDSIKRSIRTWQAAKSGRSADVPSDAPGWFAEVDFVFAILFTIELVCRLLVQDIRFVFGSGCGWNWLDTLVVIFAWIEIAGSDSNGEDGGGGMPPLRLFRLIRVLRSLRVVRSLRFFVELRLVLLSLMHALKPLLWSALTLALIMFMFANFYLQLLAVKLAIHQPVSNPDSDWAPMLIDAFPSFLQTMVSLLGIVTGGMDWIPLYQAACEASSAAGVVFVVYITLVVLGVLNVISAVFVEGALSKAKSDRHLRKQDQTQARKDMANDLIRLFLEIDEDESGMISRKEWTSFIQTETGEEFLLLFNVDILQAQQVFETLDVHANGELIVEDFVMGFMNYSRNVNKLDLEFSFRATKQVLSLMHDCSKTWEQVMSQLEKIQSRQRMENASSATLEKVHSQLNMIDHADMRDTASVLDRVMSRLDHMNSIEENTSQLCEKLQSHLGVIEKWLIRPHLAQHLESDNQAASSQRHQADNRQGKLSTIDAQLMKALS